MPESRSDVSETPELAALRLREISDLIVNLRANEKEYPANGYMIQRLAKERITIMQRFIKAVPPEDHPEH